MRLSRYIVAASVALAFASAHAEVYYNLSRDRVLLMNDDKDLRNPITLQGYFATNTEDVAYWVHSGALKTQADFNASRLLSLQNGTEHEYYENGRLLWMLNECWAGTVFPPRPEAKRNYLPWSSRSVPLSGSSMTGAQAGSVVMRNVAGASLTSPFYVDGIGTIYFDAVNVWTDNLDSAIRVEVATNTVVAAADGSEERRVLTEEDGTNNLEWAVVPAIVFPVENLAIGNALDDACTNIVLSSTGSGNSYFYRIRATLNYRCPARFRIIRPEAAASRVEKDSYCMVQVDHVFASAPPEEVVISNKGEYDKSRSATDVLGYENAFSTPFPSVSDTGLTAEVHVDYFLTNGTTALPPLNDPKIHYRWRYLNQVVRSWSTMDLVLNEEGDTLTMPEAIAPDPGLGVADLEYFFDLNADGKYFAVQPAQMGTPGASWPDGFSERKRYTSLTHSKTNALDITDAGTTNMFIRLREGESEYRNVFLCGNLNEAELPGSDLDGKLHMELVGNHRWRAYLRTETNMTARTLAFYFEAAGKTQPGDAKVGTSVVTLCPQDATVEKVPYSGFAEEIDPNTERKARYVLDGQSGYLMFEFDDRSLAVTVAHAEYQNFNDWTHSLGTQFDGNFTSTTGVSSVKRNCTENFSGERPDETESTAWQEYFDMFSSTGEYRYNQYFTSSVTPNGWNAGQGLYVRERRDAWWTPDDVVVTQTTANVGMALQMLGSGFGYLAYTGSTNGLDGIDTVTLKARLSQGLEMGDFAYYEEGMTLTNYGFTAQVQMSQRGGADMSPAHPSMSLVGYYRPNAGCYEFRVTRSSENGVTVSLFKWAPKNGAMEAELLTEWVTGLTGRYDITDRSSKTQRSQTPDGTPYNNKLVSTSPYTWDGANGTTMYITCSNAMEVTSAFRTNYFTVVSGGVALDTGLRTKSGKKYLELQYHDYTNRFSRGTYGMGMTDCNGAFMDPAYGTQLYPTGMVMSAVTHEDQGVPPHLSMDPGATQWSIPVGRMVATNALARVYVTADVREQPIKLELSPQTEHSQEWTEVARTNVVSFGEKTFTFDLRKRGRYYVRLSHAANYNDPRTDVTVDDVKLKSWRALDSASISDMGGFRDWVYTQGWISGDRLSLVPRRANPAKPCGVRSPLLDGVSLISFSYENANRNAILRLQVCTNSVDGELTEYNRALENLTYGSTAFSEYWTDVARYTFTDGSRGTKYFVFSGYRAPKNTAVRLILEPSIVNNAEKDKNSEDAKITLTSLTVLDEPALDETSWLGWNMLTSTNVTYSYLPDPAIRHFPGMSAVLNNSTSDRVKDHTELAHYEYNDPHVETPYGTNELGYVMFKARKYDTSAANNVPAYVTIFGSASGGEEDDWRVLADIEVTNATFRTFSWRQTNSTARCKKMRIGIRGLRKIGSALVDEPVTNPVQRVVLDEVSVSEVMKPTLEFVRALPFRSSLTEADPIANLGATDEQPLLGESFGFQCELKIGQLADELDMDSVSVELFYYPAASPWGYANWKGREGSIRCEKLPATADKLVFRSGYSTRSSIVPPQPDPPRNGDLAVVQYNMVAHWKDKSGNSYEAELGQGAWKQPEWYYPLDLNTDSRFGKGDAGAFSPYTILDKISPRRAWFNCVNLFDSTNRQEVGKAAARTNQYVEVAVPAGVDMTGWRVRLRATKELSANLFTMGSGGVPAVKSEGATNRYAFLAVQSPTRASLGCAADGAWNRTSFKRGSNDVILNGEITHNYAVGFELLRPNGIIEHQIAVDNAYTEYWAGRGFAEEAGPYLATNILAQAGASWFYAGCDKAGSLGVMSSHGEDAAAWEADLMETPMAVNRRKNGTLQSINADLRYFIPPNGTNYWVYLNVRSGHLTQNVGGATDATQVLIIPGGSGTNIVYTADKFYMLSSLTTNGAPVDLSAVSPARVHTFELRNVTCNLQIDAEADVSSTVAALFAKDGAENRQYQPYVIKWLQDEYGDYEPEDLKLADYYDMSGTNLVRELTLTEMYQLGINPVEKCNFIAGIGDPLDRLGRSAWPRYTTHKGEPVTNVQMSVYMMITNTVTGEARPPRVLNGLGQNSRDFTAAGSWDSTAWTSVTFKVSCRLAESAGPAKPRWIPLRWFFFDDDSFTPADSPHPFRARLEVEDPFKTWSPAYSEGYTADMEGRILFFRWQIDHVRKPDTVHLLRPDSAIDDSN